MEKLSYAKAGVDTHAGDRAVDLMKSAVEATHTKDVFGGTGGFAGMVDVSALKEYRRPLLATSTDGVGTKIEIARALDIHDTIGQDLVGMVVDDIVVVGAKPLLMTDYIACGHVEPERIANIVRGIAEACQKVNTPLLGGETAEHPGVMGADEYDIAGAATGVVEADELLGPDRVEEGDTLIAMSASGLHSNGYSLVRSILKHSGWTLDRDVPELGRTLGEELLEPTMLYTAACLEMKEAVGGQLHALSHITGGGLGANLSRVLPAGLAGRADRSTCPVPPIFPLLMQLGGVSDQDAEDTWNMGVGMVAVVKAEAAQEVMRISSRHGINAWHLGEITKDPGGAEGERRISGTKGVQGGAALLRGNWKLQ
ncbi:phosphoribosylformylglycinamidine cyclo-ligase [Boudabousia liubingyangii]|uniref:phosphoribosylformylglycinamidine cyclo-ligase n=1 Tax=Boudabousia liubingyangii TaxID=1921764 RepID=UPI00093AA208|nr:phosphoribosylformylglycinamidine cyclo-ligase [Boudabousia liubingyangii]OKL46843.1 phosphoribosylformylglycinamidine cyclo-ligase [Boudabousia liubingyangii]